MAAKLFIGTSNIVVPGTKQHFPEEFRDKSRLFYYSTLFNSLEVNRSFYKVPMPRTFERWGNEVAADFTFTIKLWKGITHNKQLVFDQDDIVRFLEAANNLNQKRGCLLVQFPASIQASHLDKVSDILQIISRNNAGHPWRIAVEFRHNSWYSLEVYQMLNGFQAAMVLHDMPASRVSENATDAPFVFMRFHGINGDYRDSYSTEFLRLQAEKIRGWLTSGNDVFAYFNNTIGAAFENAILLKHLVMQVPAGFH